MPFGPSRSRASSTRSTPRLRSQILTGELERGSRLPQETLAAELGVSRTPLREALRRLAAEGLVTLQPNYGATVAQLDFGDMRDAWTARLVIEPPAARLAAERDPAAELDRMRAAVAAQRASADPARSLDANREFHLALVSASGNPAPGALRRAPVGGPDQRRDLHGPGGPGRRHRRVGRGARGDHRRDRGRRRRPRRDGSPASTSPGIRRSSPERNNRGQTPPLARWGQTPGGS